MLKLESIPANELTFHELLRLTESLKSMMDELSKAETSPNLIYDDNTGKPIDFHCIRLHQYSSYKTFDTISKAAEEFFALKNSKEFNTQKTKNLLNKVSKLLEKSEKRLAINLQTYEENKNYDDLRLSGELLTANIYALSKGMERHPWLIITVKTVRLWIFLLIRIKLLNKTLRPTLKNITKRELHFVRTK